MTNEEIVEQIKSSGDLSLSNPLMLTLWDGVKRLVIAKADNRASFLDSLTDIDDLISESFICLPRAVDYFDPSAGASFASVFARYFVPSAFNTALYGGRSASQRRDPTKHCIYLDAPLPGYENEGLTLADTLSDSSAEDDFLLIESDSFAADVSRFLQRGIDMLPENHRIIIQAVYHDRISISEAYRRKLCGELSYQRYTQLHKEALRKLKRWITGPARAEAMRIGLLASDPVPSCKYYSGGLGEFKRTFTSTVEAIAIRHDSARLTLTNMDGLLRSAAG